MEITESNKLIAEFMGLKNISHSKKYGGIIIASPSEDDLEIVPVLYHTSWDWLMPVVEKIESLNFAVDIQSIPPSGQYCRIFSAGADVVPFKGYESKMTAVYQAVVKFIIYHNNTLNN